MNNQVSNKRKVFCIGWHKTGTTSIGDALIALGYSVVGCRLDTVHFLKVGDIDSVLEIAAGFEAVQDVPWAALYKELDIKFPGSRFVLTERDECSWLKSASKHFGSKHIPLHEWLYGEGVLGGNEDHYLDRYRSHNAQVKEYFSGRPDDFLVLDLEKGDGWPRFCRFLNKPIPKTSFPHSNKRLHKLNTKERAINSIRNFVPFPLRKFIFSFKRSLQSIFGIPDPRNRFNNFRENRKERKSWKGASH